MAGHPELPHPPQPAVSRRNALRLFGGALGTAALAGCSGNAVVKEDSSSTTTTTDTSAAALTGLLVSNGTLSPTFASGTTAYSVNVTNSTATITVTATAADDSAAIAIGGVFFSSGSASDPIALTVGSTSIAIVVTAADGTTRTYTLLVNRAGSSCTLIPSETQGPYPLSSVLADPAIVRADVRAGKSGVPLTILLSLVDVGNGCTPITDAALYIWHCDKDGQYSGYSSTQNGNHAGETYLRGVQYTDAAGQVQFTTVYPGWYAGRITHVHFQVFLGASLGGTAQVTSQLAFPQAITQAVYNSTLYAARGQNTSVSSFAADNVFADGVDLQLATVTGDVASGYVATLTVAIAT